MDLSQEQELSFVVMNLVALEEHLAFTAAKTKKQVYLDLLGEVRAMRAKHLRSITGELEGEGWCISKHLLAGCMRAMETAVKANANHDPKKAFELLDDATNLYQAFWALQEIQKKAKK